MADDVTLNSMSGGIVVATDDSGTGHVQIVKLAYSADGSRVPITADANGLKVNVGNTVTVTLGSALPAGSAVIGAVTQSGTWNVGAVTTLPALATGTNVIGGVTQSAGPWTTVERGTVIAHGSASVTTTAAQVLAVSATRRSITIQNLGTDFIWLGATGITANNGLRLAAGQTLVIDKSPVAAVFAIASTGTQAISFLTESD